jgi:hypothetical protein
MDHTFCFSSTRWFVSCSCAVVRYRNGWVSVKLCFYIFPSFSDKLGFSHLHCGRLDLLPTYSHTHYKPGCFLCGNKKPAELGVFQQPPAKLKHWGETCSLGARASSITRLWSSVNKWNCTALRRKRLSAAPLLWLKYSHIQDCSITAEINAQVLSFVKFSCVWVQLTCACVFLSLSQDAAW